MRIINRRKKVHFATVYDVYRRPGVSWMNGDERAAMTISCKDADYIPKVKDAGESFLMGDGTKVQRMHNNILVEEGGYYGDWMIKIIKTLRGHHEPQEEKVFYEVLKRIGPGSTMVELGSHWSFYSIWFNKDIKNAQNYCFEPDPGYLEGGRRNAKLNNVTLHFIQAAAGDSDSPDLNFSPETMPGEAIEVPVMSVDEIVKRNRLQKIDILHMDVQGAELSALEGAKKTIEKGKLRFIFVSTHHHSISHDPLMHKKCTRFLKEYGATIIASHSVHESYSGDGLIVASFAKEDKNFKVDVSRNISGKGLFIETEEDLAELAIAYNKLYDRFVGRG